MNRFTTFFGFLLVFGMMNQPNAQAETTQNTLAEAWQQEYAYLAAERRELQARIGEQRTENAQQIADLENEILDLESEVSTAQSLREELTESVQLLQRATATDQDDALVLESTLNQAAESIDRPIDENQTAENNLVELFSAGLSEVAHARSVHTETSSFFMDDGTQVEATLLHVGGIATYGISNDLTASLRPIGEGLFQVHEAITGPAAETIRSETLSGSLPVFLYEGTEQAIEAPQDKTVSEVLAAGGVVAYVIAGLGLAALVLALIRAIILIGANRGAKGLSELLKERLTPSLIASIETASAAKDSPVRRVVSTSIAARELDRESRMEVATEAILKEQPRIERFGVALVVVAAVAPLLGLLGTVTGMMSTFDVITEHGTGDPRMLSGGISEALITTQLGLIVAIPILLLANGLNSWARTLMGTLERLALAACLDSIPSTEGTDSTKTNIDTISTEPVADPFGDSMPRSNPQVSIANA